jgi:glutamine synthetase
MTRFDLTPEERRAIAEATPEQWAEAAADIATDRQFWQELGATMLQAFAEGFERGLTR